MKKNSLIIYSIIYTVVSSVSVYAAPDKIKKQTQRIASTTKKSNASQLQTPDPQFNALFDELIASHQALAKFAPYQPKNKAQAQAMQQAIMHSFSCAKKCDQYVKAHPKTQITEQQKKMLIDSVHGFPPYNPEKVKAFQQKEKQLLQLKNDFLQTMQTVTTKDTATSPVVVQALQKLNELNLFVKKNRGLILDQKQKKQLLEQVKKLNGIAQSKQATQATPTETTKTKSTK